MVFCRIDLGFFFFFFNDTATTEIYTLSLHDALPIQADEVESNVATGYHAIEFLLWGQDLNGHGPGAGNRPWTDYAQGDACTGRSEEHTSELQSPVPISYAVFCLKKKKKTLNEILK